MSSHPRPPIAVPPGVPLPENPSSIGSSSSSGTAKRFNKFSASLSLPLALPSTSKSTFKNSSLSSSSSSMTPALYLPRLIDVSQMDVQSALDQMKSLISFSPSQIQKVYKLAYYRKQTKDHWARDDPAFLALQIALLFLASFAYAIAFNSGTVISTTFYFGFHSIVVNYIIGGFILAAIARTFANQHLVIRNSPSNPSAVSPSSSPRVPVPPPPPVSHKALQSPSSPTMHITPLPHRTVEWMYAFDIHCNAFFPLFVILYGIQLFLLPIILQNTFFAFFLSNVLYTLAFVYYFYVTHLGYRSLTFLGNTEFFLFPIAIVVFIFVLNFVGYPFGFGWNASRIMAHLYFEGEV